ERAASQCSDGLRDRESRDGWRDGLAARRQLFTARMPIRKKPRKSAAPAATSESRVTILLEDIQGKMQATMEAVTDLRGELGSKIETLRAELSRRIAVLELAVQPNSARS